MPLESATYINQLVATNPVGASDPKSQGDDHLRMLKAVLQAQFPNLGAAAVTATAAQINTVIASGITGFANPSASIGLTANNGAALTAMRSDATPALSQAIVPTWTGTHTFNNAATGVDISAGGTGGDYALRVVASSGASARNVAIFAHSGVSNGLQITSDGTTITTNANGNLQNNGNIVPNVASNVTWTGIHIFTNIGDAIQLRSNSPALVHYESDAGSNEKLWRFGADAGVLTFTTRTDADGSGATWLQVDRTGTTIDTVNVPSGQLQYGGIEVGYRLVPRVTGGLEHGKCFATSAGLTLNTADMAAGRTFSIYNDSAAAITLTQGAGVTLRLSGTSTTGSRTIAARGLVTVWCNSGTEAIVSGAVT